MPESPDETLAERSDTNLETVDIQTKLGTRSIRPKFLSRVLDSVKKHGWEAMSTVEIFFALRQIWWLVTIFSNSMTY
jgi:hypothetical protein